MTPQKYYSLYCPTTSEASVVGMVQRLNLPANKSLKSSNIFVLIQQLRLLEFLMKWKIEIGIKTFESK